jgi:hypothetical protein
LPVKCFARHAVVAAIRSACALRAHADVHAPNVAYWFLNAAELDARSAVHARAAFVRSVLLIVLADAVVAATRAARSAAMMPSLMEFLHSFRRFTPTLFPPTVREDEGSVRGR